MDLRRFRRDVRNAREERGWTQDELAAKVGVTRNTVHRLERGQHTPETATLMATADVLHLKLSEYDDPMTSPVTPVEHPTAATLAEVPLNDEQRRTVNLIAGLPPEDTQNLAREFLDFVLARRAKRERRPRHSRRPRLSRTSRRNRWKWRQRGAGGPGEGAAPVAGASRRAARAVLEIARQTRLW
jgi:transcriptional regulator with XRE-family HTH domain